MRIRALLTSVVVVIAPPRVMAAEDRSRSTLSFGQPRPARTILFSVTCPVVGGAYAWARAYR